MSFLTEVDPEIAQALENEEMRQRRNLVLRRSTMAGHSNVGTKPALSEAERGCRARPATPC